MRALIVDDEAPARLALRHLLAASPDVDIIGEAASAVEAIELTDALHPDALFLDIEMPGCNGFNLLAELNPQPAIVFVTAYDNYAVRAFETNAVDYLLKPVQPAALARALQRLRHRQTHLSADLLQQLRTNLFPQSPAKLAARRGSKVVLVPRRDILYIQAEDRLVFLHTATDRFLTNRTVTDLEALLPASEFHRISRATLVNLEAVQELYPWMESGLWRLRLKSGVELDISRDRLRPLRQMLGF